MKTRFFALFVFILISTGPNAFALTTLKQVQVSDGDEVTLLFDREISPKQIKTDFLRNIVQLSIRNVAVYPAKIVSVSGSELKKVFAYQYTPNLVRFRLTVKDKAVNYKNRVKLITKGKMLTVGVAPAIAKGQDRLTIQSAQAVRKTVKSKEIKPTLGEEKLIREVVKGSKKDAAKKTKLTGAKELPSPFKSFFWLAVVISIFGVFALAIRRLRRGRTAGIPSALKKFARNRFAKDGKMIEVISNHYLGPKKSIAIVKAQGQLLMLGITDESINLITRLDRSFSADDEDLVDFGAGTGAGAEAGKSQFDEMLTKETVKPEIDTSGSRVRDQIKQKVQGMKIL